MSDRQKGAARLLVATPRTTWRLIGTPHDRGAGNRADQHCAFADALPRSQVP
jgi:hypothetical protein